MARPLEEPMRTWHARRGGSGVEEAGGRLRRPGLMSANVVAPLAGSLPDEERHDILQADLR
jgi:hypothetical protein